jgi:hypothetical protein
MSGTTIDVVVRPAATVASRMRAAGLAIVGAAATAIYGAYGGSAPVPSQEHAVPFLVGADIVIALLVFGLLVPWALRSPGRAAGWGLGLAVFGLLAMIVTFWSGVLVIVVGAGVLLGTSARRVASDAGRSSGLATAAVATSVALLVVSTTLLILGNTVLA